MGVLKNIAIGVLALTLLTFVALFGQLPALRKTPIGWLQRALCLRLPAALKAIDSRATGGKITSKSKRLGRYLFYEQNPVVLILFLVLLTGSAALFIWNALYQLPLGLVLPIPVVLIPPYWFTYLCASHKTHYIRPANHQDRLHDYPYDHVLFRPGTVCKTCNLAKPARSKHCSLCGYCVAKCDHHCPWVNNCLGRGNYRYFLALLLALGILQIYGAGLSYWILKPYLDVDNTASYLSSDYWLELGDGIVDAVNMGGLSIAGVGLLAATTAALPLGLLGYHCYLIWAGMTTNETQKWADWRDDMSDAIVFRTTRDKLLTHAHLRSYGDGEANPMNGAAHKGLADDLGVTEDDPCVSWPIRSAQVIVRTNDGKPPRGQEALWTRIWSLSDVDNLYDLGGWDNFMEVLHGR
ncbi:hypothetical protein LTR36_006331 [Oleoguttula mirabilis]|uniref:Palmitoyltransferase n=1 Tax=Oleoguttula mirabilis TaxID=1507867 RepID=A0AAV9JUQ4_9PEZI|nr:hypothetical protein LTR36_006331 [Oleoguttula mirabilis]